jgi:hypothetical protein
MQRRHLSISLAVIIFLLLFTPVVGASEVKNHNVKVFVNETEIIFDANSGRPYINKDNRTMLPFRKVAEAAKAEGNTAAFRRPPRCSWALLYTRGI